MKKTLNSATRKQALYMLWVLVAAILWANNSFAQKVLVHTESVAIQSANTHSGLGVLTTTIGVPLNINVAIHRTKTALVPEVAQYVWNLLLPPGFTLGSQALDTIAKSCGQTLFTVKLLSPSHLEFERKTLSPAQTEQGEGLVCAFNIPYSIDQTSKNACPIGAFSSAHTLTKNHAYSKHSLSVHVNPWCVQTLDQQATVVANWSPAIANAADNLGIDLFVTFAQGSFNSYVRVAYTPKQPNQSPVWQPSYLGLLTGSISTANFAGKANCTATYSSFGAGVEIVQNDDSPTCLVRIRGLKWNDGSNNYNTAGGWTNSKAIVNRQCPEAAFTLDSAMLNTNQTAQLFIGSSPCLYSPISHLTKVTAAGKAKSIKVGTPVIFKLSMNTALSTLSTYDLTAVITKNHATGLKINHMTASCVGGMYGAFGATFEVYANNQGGFDFYTDLFDHASTCELTITTVPTQTGWVELNIPSSAFTSTPKRMWPALKAGLMIF